MKLMKTVASPEGVKRIELSSEEYAQRQADEKAWEEQKKKPYEPTETEIILHALALKTGLTEAEKIASKNIIIAKKGVL